MNARKKSRGRKALDSAPDWMGCGRIITQESWDGFIAAQKKHWADKDRERMKQTA